jgi:hypothetical protein
MSTEAATPTGGAEAAARPDASAPTVHDRLKAHLATDPTPTVAPSIETTDTDSEAPPQEDADETEAPPSEETPPDDAQDDATEATYSTVEELAEALGWDLDKILDLEAKTKIDGKEEKRRLRDLIKSHQLEGHLNQKLMTAAEERKAFEAERNTKQREMADKLLRMDAGLQTLERALASEFAGVDWQQLQTENPLEFNAKYVGYQQRMAQLQAIAGQIAQEQQHYQAEAARQAQSYLAEQKQLLQAKVPEWANEGRRNKDRAEIVEYLKDHGISKEEFESISDHRQILVLRDAVAWRNLQKSKPATLNKIKAAPKLLKPGTTQSRAAQDNLQMSKDRERLRSTGKPRDAKAVLKKLLFN